VSPVICPGVVLDRGGPPTTRWLVRFGYDGSGFAGWARQPGLRTVEGEIRLGVVRRGLAATAEEAGISVASRTDRGVSARANALTLTSGLEGRALLRSLNGLAPDLLFRAASPVPPEFDPRKARSRWYRYFQSADGRSREAWRENARLLTGRLDVRSFGRGIPSDRPTWREVDRLEVSQKGRWLVVDVRARSFVWGMVRKIVAALRAIEDGTIAPEAVARAVRGELRLTLPLAEAEPLVLWEVAYPIRWAYHAEGTARHHVAYRAREGERARVRGRLLDAVYR
jgi:tRNA pseudouridine38-40 synthase